MNYTGSLKGLKGQCKWHLVINLFICVDQQQINEKVVLAVWTLDQLMNKENLFIPNSSLRYRFQWRRFTWSCPKSLCIVVMSQLIHFHVSNITCWSPILLQIPHKHQVHYVRKQIVYHFCCFSRPTGPTDLILDEYGRTVDARGRVIQLPKFVPTIKVSIALHDIFIPKWSPSFPSSISYCQTKNTEVCFVYWVHSCKVLQKEWNDFTQMVISYISNTVDVSRLISENCRN